jgi:hypothetical protein
MVDWKCVAEGEERLFERIWGRLAEVQSLLAAIEAGELLAALPPDPCDRTRHNVGVCLLAVLQRELAGAMQVVEEAGRF